MSHFSSIKTQIRNLTSLKYALKDLNIDWKEGPSPVRGYQGQTSQADLVIDRKTIMILVLAGMVNIMSW